MGTETLNGSRIVVRPVGKEPRLKSTWSAKPPEAVMVIVELLVDPPGTSMRKSRLAVSANPGPGTVIVMSTESGSRLPDSPKTVTE